MKMTKTILAMAAAMAATVGYAGDSAPFRLDTMEETRVARAEEVITYSTEWDNAGKVIVAVDGETLKEASAPASGDVTWNARNASAARRTRLHGSAPSLAGRETATSSAAGCRGIPTRSRAYAST